MPERTIRIPDEERWRRSRDLLTVTVQQLSTEVLRGRI